MELQYPKGDAYNEVNFKVRLSARTKRINAPMFLLVLNIAVICLRPLVDPREPDQFEHSARQRASSGF